MPEPGSRARHEPGDEYAGRAVVHAERAVDVEVRLRGHFEPIDGRFHWWGRIGADPVLDGEVGSGATVRLETPYGAAEGRLSDVDLWGRFRVAGTGRPPF